MTDESLSPELIIKLKQLGYSAKHAREIQLKGADDIKIVEWAIKNKAVIIAGDLDFGELWYWRYRGKLSVIVLRIRSYKIESQYEVIKFMFRELNNGKSNARFMWQVSAHRKGYADVRLKQVQ